MKENIINVLNDVTKAIGVMEINDLLGLTTVAELQELQKNLQDLVETGLLHETRKSEYILIKNCKTLRTGIITINRTGNGFLLVEGPDIYIDKSNLNGAINGDMVEIDLINYQNSVEGKVIRILKRNLNNIVGEIIKEHNHLAFKPDDAKLDIKLKLDYDSLKQCVEGHKVLLQVIKELGKNYYLAKVAKIIGHKDDPGVDIISIALRHSINIDFSEATIKELAFIPSEVSPEELRNRKDLTGKQIFTIDGDDTKDIDDAISINKNGDNYELGVHIADVSYYVKVGTALYEDAYLRGTSAYLADTVIPMIPHQLSNGICSLNEGVIRLTLTCDMTINPQGKVIDYDIYPSYIKSRKKMTYKNVNQILEAGKIPEGYEAFASDLKLMQELAHILRKEREGRGYIDFELDEAKVVQDETGKAIDIVKRVRGEGEKLIEDFMIAANETVATHVTNMDLPFIYRVHDVPNSEKIEDFKNLVKQMGYGIQTNLNKITPLTMQSLLAELKNKKEFPILSAMLLRSMKKAVYSTNNIHHFGLASRCYTHFTSPIRRFPDLTVHRLLRTYCFNHELDMETINFNAKYLIDVAENSSTTEVNAVEAERDVMDMKMAEYMQDHIGETFEGIINSVTNFGFFVELANLIEGLVHISTLEGYFTYVPEMLSLVNLDSKVSYRIGDTVKIVVTAASKENGTIDFALYQGDENGNQE